MKRANIDTRALCRQFTIGKRTVKQLAVMHGYDDTTIIKRLKEGLGETHYQRELDSRQKENKVAEQKPYSLASLPDVFLKRWAPELDENLSKAIGDLHDEENHLSYLGGQHAVRLQCASRWNR